MYRYRRKAKREWDTRRGSVNGVLSEMYDTHSKPSAKIFRYCVKWDAKDGIQILAAVTESFPT